MKVGDGVRLAPKRRSDVFDMVLAGKLATVVAIETTLDGAEFLVVTPDGDEAHELGARAAMAHRFFFGREEVEPLSSDETHVRPTRRVLVAGLGNVFFGDDGFGVEVVRHLRAHGLPRCAELVDFGVRGVDLAYAMLSHEAVILLDAAALGQPPGTLSVLEPSRMADGSVPDPHVLNAAGVLAFVARLGGGPTWLRLVGCEPARLGGPDTVVVGLSEPVERAAREAIPIVESLVREFCESAGCTS